MPTPTGPTGTGAGDQGQGGIQSVARAFAVLEALGGHPAGLQLPDLVDATGLHKSTVHRLLSSLIELGYAAKAPGHGGRYRLTLKLAELTAGLLEDSDVAEAARPLLGTLRDTVQESVHLVVRDGLDIVYIQKWESRAATYQLVSRIGMRRPLYCTAVGKAILSTLPDEEVGQIWRASKIEAYTPHTIVAPEALLRELAEVRARGYALDNEENELGVRCAAAPILDYQGRCEAAFSVSAPALRMPDSRIAEIAPLIRETAAAISRQMGHR